MGENTRPDLHAFPSDAAAQPLSSSAYSGVIFPSSTPRPLTVWDLGRASYEPVHALQRALVAARQADEIGDTLLFVEHPPVVTLGRGSQEGNLLLDPAGFARHGIEVHEIGRGGDVTYHGPGQLVGYPILKLEKDREDVRKYVASLEETMIRTAQDYGVSAGRLDGFNGTWVTQDGMTPKKIGAVGVRISRWVTMHGFAFNVNPQMGHFSLIVPCGITDKGVTSLALETGSAPPLTEVMQAAAQHFAMLHSSELTWEQRLPSHFAAHLESDPNDERSQTDESAGPGPRASEGSSNTHHEPAKRPS